MIVPFIQAVDVFTATNKSLVALVIEWLQIKLSDQEDVIKRIKKRYFSSKVKAVLFLILVLFALVRFQIAVYEANEPYPHHAGECRRNHHSSLWKRYACTAKPLFFALNKGTELKFADSVQQDSDMPDVVEYLIWPAEAPRNYAKHIQHPLRKINTKCGRYISKFLDGRQETTFSLSQSIDGATWGRAHVGQDNDDPGVPTKISAFPAQPLHVSMAITIASAAMECCATPAASSPMHRADQAIEGPLRGNRVIHIPEIDLTNEEKSWILLGECMWTFGLDMSETDAIFKNCGPCGRVERSPAFAMCKGGHAGEEFMEMLRSFREVLAEESEGEMREAFKAEFKRRGGFRWLQQGEQKRNKDWKGDDIFAHML